VQILVQRVFMTSLATNPKFSSMAFLDFELQEKSVKLNLNFHSKSIRQNYGQGLQNCRFTLTETNKLNLQFYEFSLNF
jgi:hypothetical protein